MLEFDVLVLEPWDRPRFPHRKRRVLDVDGAVLGFAEWQPAWPFPIIHRLSWPVVRIFETDDASLLCTAYRRSRSRWEMCDAENRLIGACQTETNYSGPFHATSATRIDDALGQPAAWVLGDPGVTQRLIGEPTGGEMGSVTSTHEYTRLEFDPSSEPSPFSKMVLLAAVIVET